MMTYFFFIVLVSCCIGYSMKHAHKLDDEDEMP